MSEPTDRFPPDWYPDPGGKHELRWYDGEAWTEHVSDAGVVTNAPVLEHRTTLPTLLSRGASGLVAVANRRASRGQALWADDPTKRYPYRFHDGTEWTDLVTEHHGGVIHQDPLHPDEAGESRKLAGQASDLIRIAALKKRAREVGARQASAHQRAQIICPHCQTRGFVSMSQGTRKTGVSGSKATAAVITNGKSVLVTGLSGTVSFTRGYCSNCGVAWDV